MNKENISSLDPKRGFSDLSFLSKIIVKEELKNFIPPLKQEQLFQLEEMILNEGVRDALILWPLNGEFILVDGHNRFSICQKLNLNFPFQLIDFKNIEEAKYYMLVNQLSRRNLSPQQESYFRGKRYNLEKSQGKRTDLTYAQSEQKSSDAKAVSLASEYGVSEATIRRDAEFAKGLDIIGLTQPDLKEQVLRGDSKVSKKTIQNIAKGNSTHQESIESKKSKAVSKTTKPTAEEVATIAFQYIVNERRDLSAVFASLSISHPFEPLEFFLIWHEQALKQLTNEN